MTDSTPHRPRTTRIPKYRRQPVPGGGDRAFVVLSGSRHYLGEHGTKASREAYHRLIAEWEAGGRRNPAPVADQTIAELCDRFWAFALTYYRGANGRPSSSIYGYQMALRHLRKLYGRHAVKDFGPRELKAVRHAMMKNDWSRGVVNSAVGLIRRVFGWGVEEGIVKADVLVALRAVRALERGRTDARETDPIKPVPDAYIDAIKPHVSRQVWALVQVQLLTGARGGELLTMRAIDLDTTGRVWLYRPKAHKGQWRGHERIIYLGPRAQAIVREFMAGRSVDAPLFSPAEAEAERRQREHAARKTPDGYGNGPGTNQRRRPKWKPGDCYTREAYRRAVARACDEAFPPSPELERLRLPGGKGGKSERWETDKELRQRIGKDGAAELRKWQADHRWHPHQLRHNAATNLRREFGIDLAQTILGHRLGSTITEIYAEVNTAKALDAMAKIG